MIKFASFALVTTFWVVMNVLLWRSEFGTSDNLGASVPPLLIWEKILTAPDDSALSVNLQGKRLGYLRLRPNATEGIAPGTVVNENEPEGIVRKLSEYVLDVEASLAIETIARSIRLNGEFVFDPSLKWKRFQTLTSVRPNTWQLKANAAERRLWIQSSDGESEWIQNYSMDDLKNPQRLLSQVDSPILAALLPQYLSAARTNSQSSAVSLGLKWEARFEWLRIGRNRVRIYRLEARLLDRHRIVVLVSRVGEILRIELPGDLKLINDVLYAS